MSKSSRHRISPFVHRWLGLVLAAFIVLYALSGIVLNHRALVSRFHVSRSWLPDGFQYEAWNNGAVKGAVSVNDREALLYGAIGVWRGTADFRDLYPCNQGLPPGADRRHIKRLYRTAEGQLLAGTRYGLYRWDEPQGRWRSVPLPMRDAHVVDMTRKDDTLYVLTRSDVLAGPITQLDALRPVSLPPPPGWDGRISLFRLLWHLHDGALLGLPGKLLVDSLGVVLIVLTFTGACLFLGPRWIKWRKRRGTGRTPRAVRLVRWSRTWHRRVGICAVFFLAACVLLGMFLRPPLLLAVIRKRAKTWPGTALHNAGPWHDRLRRLHYDASRDRFVLSTADGFYVFDGSLGSRPYRPAVEPPVSVMGVTVFEQHAPGLYLVGSFMGLYMWNPERHAVVNWITKEAPSRGRVRLPFGQHLVSGYVRDTAGREFVFDYRQGAMPLGHAATFPTMPDDARHTPMSLWALALETHTGRVYSVFPTWLQMLWVFISGLGVLGVLVTGVVWWCRVTRRRRNASSAERQTPAAAREGQDARDTALPRAPPSESGQTAGNHPLNAQRDLVHKHAWE